MIASRPSQFGHSPSRDLAQCCEDSEVFDDSEALILCIVSFVVTKEW